MGIRINDLAHPTFQGAFANVRRSWFRLETLQVYAEPSERERLRAFLAGEPPPPVTERSKAWTSMIRAHVDAGRRLRRVHVIEEPLTPYIQFELTRGYAAGIAGGEEIHVISVQQGQWPDGIPKHDFWIFDTEVWRMDYDTDGRVLGAETVDDPAAVTQHLAWRDAALQVAVPLADYLSGSPQRRIS